MNNHGNISSLAVRQLCLDLCSERQLVPYGDTLRRLIDLLLTNRSLVPPLSVHSSGAGFIRDPFTIHSHFSERGYQGMMPVALIQRTYPGKIYVINSPKQGELTNLDDVYIVRSRQS